MYSTFTNVFAFGFSLGCGVGSYTGYKIGSYFTKRECMKQMEEVLEKVKVVNLQDAIKNN